MNDLITDPRAKRWGTVAKVAALGTGCVFVAPFIGALIGGALGLIAFGVIVGALWFTRNWFAAVGENMRLKLIKHEAAKNPVETLQNEHREQNIVLNDRKGSLELMSGTIRSLDQVIDKLEHEFPDSPELPQMRADQAELIALEAARKDDWQAAYLELGKFAKEIRRVSMLWDVAQAAAKARNSSGLTEGAWLSKLKTETSIDAIRSKLNTQLSALSVERMQIDADRILKGKAIKTAVPA